MTPKKELSDDAKKVILTIAEIIKQRREEIEMSQQELANALQCSLTFVKRMERGDVNFRLNTIAAVCRALDIPLNTDFGKG